MRKRQQKEIYILLMQQFLFYLKQLVGNLIHMQFLKACISCCFCHSFCSQRESLCLLMKRSFSVWWRTSTVSTAGIQLLHLNITSKKDISDLLYTIKILALVIEHFLSRCVAQRWCSAALTLSVVCDREVLHPLLLCWWRPWPEPLALPNVHENTAKDKGLQNPYYQPWFVPI